MKVPDRLIELYEDGALGWSSAGVRLVRLHDGLGVRLDALPPTRFVHSGFLTLSRFVVAELIVGCAANSLRCEEAADEQKKFIGKIEKRVSYYVRRAHRAQAVEV